mmetsp:Transcript_21864/g.27583  ORF Transcript_21864/g.27583 Transcript_21864/m.27583 type:complete len:86 (-) Transcript_21864:79-336(-)
MHFLRSLAGLMLTSFKEGRKFMLKAFCFASSVMIVWMELIDCFIHSLMKHEFFNMCVKEKQDAKRILEKNSSINTLYSFIKDISQ